MAIHCAPFGGGSGSGRSRTEIAWWWPSRTQLATIPDSVSGDFLDRPRHAQDRGLEGDLQVVLDHHGEAAQLLVIAVCVDRGLFNQRDQFFVAGFADEAHRQSRAVAVSDAADDDQAFVDSISEWPER